MHRPCPFARFHSRFVRFPPNMGLPTTGGWREGSEQREASSVRCFSRLLVSPYSLHDFSPYPDTGAEAGEAPLPHTRLQKLTAGLPLPLCCRLARQSEPPTTTAPLGGCGCAPRAPCDSSYVSPAHTLPPCAVLDSRVSPPCSPQPPGSQVLEAITGHLHPGQHYTPPARTVVATASQMGALCLVPGAWCRVP